jgi:hypothetical protein
LKFGQENEDRTYLHFRIRKEGGQWTADGRCPASASKAREELQRLLGSMDIDKKGVTDKSFKMLGVTSMLEKGAQFEEVALHGRWRSIDMPLRHKHNSEQFKLSTASKVPY